MGKASPGGRHFDRPGLYRPYGRRTLSVPGHGVPLSAAWTQSATVAFGPESVKSAKKLSGRFGNTVAPDFTVLFVTTGKGSTMFLRACLCSRISRASSSEATDRN